MVLQLIPDAVVGLGVVVLVGVLRIAVQLLNDESLHVLGKPGLSTICNGHSAPISALPGSVIDNALAFFFPFFSFASAARRASASEAC